MALCHASMVETNLNFKQEKSLLRSSNTSNCSINAFRIARSPVQRSGISSKGRGLLAPTPLLAHRRVPTRAGSPDIDVSSLLDDLDLPEIDADLASFQAEAGALFGVRHAATYILITFLFLFALCSLYICVNILFV